MNKQSRCDKGLNYVNLQNDLPLRGNKKLHKKFLTTSKLLYNLTLDKPSVRDITRAPEGGIRGSGT